MEWYRKNTWTEADEKDFYTRLKRARKYNRAQYLKIQALSLIDKKKKKLLDVAETLLNRVLEEYPENRIEKSPVLNSLGYIYELREKYDLAIDYYDKSLDFENEFPNVITTSYLDFSELVIKEKKTEHFPKLKIYFLKKLKQVCFQ